MCTLSIFLFFWLLYSVFYQVPVLAADDLLLLLFFLFCLNETNVPSYKLFRGKNDKFHTNRSTNFSFIRLINSYVTKRKFKANFVFLFFGYHSDWIVDIDQHLLWKNVYKLHRRIALWKTCGWNHEQHVKFLLDDIIIYDLKKKFPNGFLFQAS